MAKRTARRLHREFTPEERDRREQAVVDTEAQRDSIVEQGGAVKSAQQASKKVLAQLRAERERQGQGLGLADMMRRTGMSREAISRLENEEAPNPTVRTLTRYASALGLQLTLSAGSSP